MTTKRPPPFSLSHKVYIGEEVYRVLNNLSEKRTYLLEMNFRTLTMRNGGVRVWS